MKSLSIILAFLVLSSLIISGCGEIPTQENTSNYDQGPATTDQPVVETPVGIGEVDAYLTNWDSDPEDDGYSVWFTLKNSKGEIIPADGKVIFAVVRDGSEISRTSAMDVKASDFKMQTVWQGPKQVDKLCYLNRFETSKIDHNTYTIFVHFFTTENKEYVMEEQRTYV